MTEFQDEEPVTDYTAKLTGTFTFDASFGSDLHLGKVVMWLVCASTGKFSVWDTRDGVRRRENVQKIEDAVPLTGVLRDQAIIYLSHGGAMGAVDFGTPVESELELDRLQEYLLKSWPMDVPERPKANQVIDAVMNLLEAYQAGEAPKSALEQALGAEPEPEPLEPAEVEEPSATPVEEEEDVEPVELEPEPLKGVEEVEVRETFEGPGSVPEDVAALKLRMKELIGEEDELVPESTMRTAKMNYDEDPTDDSGMPVTVFGDDHEVIGSVYSPGHSGRNREFIEAVV